MLSTKSQLLIERCERFCRSNSIPLTRSDVTKLISAGEVGHMADILFLEAAPLKKLPKMNDKKMANVLAANKCALLDIAVTIRNISWRLSQEEAQTLLLDVIDTWMNESGNAYPSICEVLHTLEAHYRKLASQVVFDDDLQRIANNTAAAEFEYFAKKQANKELMMFIRPNDDRNEVAA